MYQNAHPLIGRFRTLGYSQMVGESIDERPLEVTVAGMHDHSGGLVDNEEVVVLIDYVQRNVLRQDLKAAAAVRHHEADHIAWADDKVRFRNLVIHTYITLFDRALNPVSGSVLEMSGHILVHTHRGLADIDVEPEMLEHPLLLVLDAILLVVVKSLLVHVIRSSCPMKDRWSRLTP